MYLQQFATGSEPAIPESGLSFRAGGIEFSVNFNEIHIEEFFYGYSWGKDWNIC